ncbi:OapA family protein [Cellvibrio fibrivorans]|uniref:Murein DD-endopeptidase MepM/ murein hydrolase activator NlpD n=1 Tax=Cellvibrio fibrivorans TaxID=126350 RepID=A0ABU1US40_9GAMM|nr:peptidoglycan DD-metalloendopeptidase family protein [Cellvibrio fibrivorans]MDR7087999.1 murein DD-endopeptidase MepM/ murein hydrolase activator NlpD [Cellvibrio fibrivorans]
MPQIKNYYKIIRSTLLQYVPRGHLAAAVVLSAGLVIILGSNSQENSAIVSIPSKNIPGLEIQGVETPATPISVPAVETIIQTVAAIPEAVKVQDQKPAVPQWKEFTVQNGDNLSILFKRAGLNDRTIYELFSDAKDAKDLRNIRPGQKMAFLVENGQLQGLNYIIDELNSLNFTRGTKGFTGKEIALKPDVKYAFRQASIDSSLYMAGKRAGMPSNLTMELANIFGWDIDFALDIQKGDSFKVMYEEQFLEGKRIGTGKIMAAEFTNAGKTFKAVRYTDKQGASNYYTPDGRGMHKAFLRSPIEFAKISSHFSLGRKHPVLHIIRAHKGTDYAAVRGTPIRSTGNGKVAFAGRKNGFGNTVVIQHGQGIETLYGHMNGFAKGIRSGSRVSQGDVIGYVGSTGLASGPHLHYEFHVNGQVRNPVTVPLPKSIGIEKTELARFNETTRPLIAKLDQYKSSSRLAVAKGGSNSN